MQVVSFQNGHAKLGGRKAGTPNRGTSVRECLERLNVDPVEEVVKIAQSDESSHELKARIWLSLAEYVSPKLRAVDQTIGAPDVNKLQIEIIRVAPQTGMETEAPIERPEQRLNGKAAMPYQKG
jgi:hypothetical protein